MNSMPYTSIIRQMPRSYNSTYYALPTRHPETCHHMILYLYRLLTVTTFAIRQIQQDY
jgi:hypothetical protein